ncbi:MAG TPA: hypothetical protein PLT07_09185 [Trueperaceae bacterium]|nr:hypothetical protein [Trueperaceae bacterium]
MNYAALLGVLTAVTFTLPLVARLAGALGLHRNMGVAVSLLLAVLTAGAWYVKSVRERSPLRRGAEGGKLLEGPPDEPPKEHDASL